VEEIRNKNQELQFLNAEKDKFFSIIAHDLRSPFNVFLGLIRIMETKLPLLTSILRNLLSNAVKFTPKNGSIKITAPTLSDGSFQLSIKDSGISNTQKMMEDLFDLEGKANRRGTEGESSTGLGLIICKDFIEKHGGQFDVESTEGIGTTFKFTLPVR
jgi:signal transduction histidine kinase